MVIIQMFNQSFLSIGRSLPRLSKLGITHLLVSPPQKSNPSKQWWARYQPVDYRVIEGPLGSETELEALCLAARRLGIVVMADAVLNHMSNLPHYVTMKGRQVLSARFPRFSAPDFCRPGHKRDPLPYRGRALPELNLGSPWVQSELRNYLRLLISLGVGGFRIDAARHIADGPLKAQLPHDPPDALVVDLETLLAKPVRHPGHPVGLIGGDVDQFAVSVSLAEQQRQLARRGPPGEGHHGALARTERLLRDLRRRSRRCCCARAPWRPPGSRSRGGRLGFPSATRCWFRRRSASG